MDNAQGIARHPSSCIGYWRVCKQYGCLHFYNPNDIDAITTATETYNQPVAKQKAKKPKNRRVQSKRGRKMLSRIS